MVNEYSFWYIIPGYFIIGIIISSMYYIKRKLDYPLKEGHYVIKEYDSDTLWHCETLCLFWIFIVGIILLCCFVILIIEMIDISYNLIKEITH